jgi:hypothetical protein
MAAAGNSSSSRVGSFTIEFTWSYVRVRVGGPKTSWVNRNCRTVNYSGLSDYPFLSNQGEALHTFLSLWGGGLPDAARFAS